MAAFFAAGRMAPERFQSSIIGPNNRCDISQLCSRSKIEQRKMLQVRGRDLLVTGGEQRRWLRGQHRSNPNLPKGTAYRYTDKRLRMIEFRTARPSDVADSFDPETSINLRSRSSSILCSEKGFPPSFVYLSISRPSDTRNPIIKYSSACSTEFNADRLLSPHPFFAACNQRPGDRWVLGSQAGPIDGYSAMRSGPIPT